MEKAAPSTPCVTQSVKRAPVLGPATEGSESFVQDPGGGGGVPGRERVAFCTACGVPPTGGGGGESLSPVLYPALSPKGLAKLCQSEEDRQLDCGPPAFVLSGGFVEEDSATNFVKNESTFLECHRNLFM